MLRTCTQLRMAALTCALKNVFAVRCFILTFALEMFVRGARENALVE